jgi:hypothetical protein
VDPTEAAAQAARSGVPSHSPGRAPTRRRSGQVSWEVVSSTAIEPASLVVDGFLRDLHVHNGAICGSNRGRDVRDQEVAMSTSFKEALETLVNQRIADGEDPLDLFEELRREANQVFGHYNLEYELGQAMQPDPKDS